MDTELWGCWQRHSGKVCCSDLQRVQITREQRQNVDPAQILSQDLKTSVSLLLGLKDVTNREFKVHWQIVKSPLIIPVCSLIL